MARILGLLPRPIKHGRQHYLVGLTGAAPVALAAEYVEWAVDYTLIPYTPRRRARPPRRLARRAHARHLKRGRA